MSGATIAGTRVTGYAAKEPGEPLVPFVYPSPQLGEHDVRVSVTHCGLCYTDVHGIDDYFNISTFPFVPGHEIVGFVDASGPAVTGLREGDRVGIGWQGRACGQCEWCRRGEQQLCLEIEEAATWKPYGGFASSVVVDADFAYPLPAAMPAPDAAVLMCAGATVFAPLRRHSGGPSQHVGILGVGGLGHLALQFAHALGSEVTAISSTPDKEREARAFGADHFVVGDRAGLRGFQDQLDLLLSTTHGETRDWESLLLTLKRTGRLVLVGFPHMTVDPMDLVVHQLSITGSILASRAEMRDMLAFAQDHGIRPAVELVPMSDVNDAIRRLKANAIRYRAVLVNDATATT